MKYLALALCFVASLTFIYLCLHTGHETFLIKIGHYITTHVNGFICVCLGSFIILLCLICL